MHPDHLDFGYNVSARHILALVQRLNSTKANPRLSIHSQRSTVSIVNFLAVSDTILNVVAVIQELMQTDLHRVIRTQHLTDDHCQVGASRCKVDTQANFCFLSTLSTKPCGPSSRSTAQTLSTAISSRPTSSSTPIAT
jgi:hypothetical protein